MLGTCHGDLRSILSYSKELRERIDVWCLLTLYTPYRKWLKVSGLLYGGYKVYRVNSYLMLYLSLGVEAFTSLTGFMTCVTNWASWSGMSSCMQTHSTHAIRYSPSYGNTYITCIVSACKGSFIVLQVALLASATAGVASLAPLTSHRTATQCLCIIENQVYACTGVLSVM